MCLLGQGTTLKVECLSTNTFLGRQTLSNSSLPPLTGKQLHLKLKMTVPFIQTRSDYDFTLRFRIDNVREYFHHSASTQGPPPVQRTEIFGHGWYFRWVPSQHVGDDDAGDGLSCFLAVGRDGYPAPITWNIRGLSSCGTKEYFDLHMMHTFPSLRDPCRLNDWGWNLTLGRSHWDRFETLRMENALYITANVHAPVISFKLLDTPPPPLPDIGKCLGISHEVVTTGGGQPCDVRFAFALPQGMSEDQDVRSLYAHQGIIERNCPRLAECESFSKYAPLSYSRSKNTTSTGITHPIRAREVVVGLFGEDGADNEGTNYHIAAMRDGADELDGDFDSDAEDYDFEDDIDSEGVSDDDEEYTDEEEDNEIGPDSSPISVTNSGVTEPGPVAVLNDSIHDLNSRVADPPGGPFGNAPTLAASVPLGASQSLGPPMPEHRDGTFTKWESIGQSYGAQTHISPNLDVFNCSHRTWYRGEGDT